MGNCPTRVELTLAEEIKFYKELVLDKEYTNPLQFWNEMKSKLPKLCKISRRVLAIQASSAEAERNFSHTGLILTKLRSRIKKIF